MSQVTQHDQVTQNDQIPLPTELAEACNIVSELTAALDLLAYPNRVAVNRAHLFELVVPLSTPQRQLLLEFVLGRGVDLALMLQLMRAGLDMQLYFAAVDRGAHPALPGAVFTASLEKLPAPMVQQIISNSEAAYNAIAQMQLVGQIHALLASFFVESDDAAGCGAEPATHTVPFGFDRQERGLAHN